MRINEHLGCLNKKNEVILQAILQKHLHINHLNIEYMGLLQDKLSRYTLPQKYKELGLYPYFREIEGMQGTEVEMGGKMRYTD